MKIQDIASYQMVKFGQKTLVADSEHKFGMLGMEEQRTMRRLSCIALYTPMVDRIHQNKIGYDVNVPIGK